MINLRAKNCPVGRNGLMPAALAIAQLGRAARHDQHCQGCQFGLFEVPPKIWPF